MCIPVDIRHLCTGFPCRYRNQGHYILRVHGLCVECVNLAETIGAFNSPCARSVRVCSPTARAVLGDSTWDVYRFVIQNGDLGQRCRWFDTTFIEMWNECPVHENVFAQDTKGILCQVLKSNVLLFVCLHRSFSQIKSSLNHYSDSRLSAGIPYRRRVVEVT